MAHNRRFSQGITLICCIIYMFVTEIPDPFLGPKGVRMLLFTRGFCGSVPCHIPSIAADITIHSHRFFGLFGVYYSLQYLSLSDATVLTYVSCQCTTNDTETPMFRFLSPLTTAIAGALLLNESFTRKEAFSGGGLSSPHCFAKYLNVIFLWA